MIEIKRCNYVTGDAPSVSFGLSRIIDFLETSGRTPLFLSNPLKSLLLKYFIHTSRLDFEHISNLTNTLENKSNLFRVDLIIIDLWYIKTISSIIEFKELLDKVGIDYIIVSSKYHYKDSDDIRVYKIEKESIDVGNNSLGSYHIPDYKYWITDKIGGWRSTIDDLIISYRRDKKIDDIFRKD